VELLDLLKLRSATALDVDESGNILVRSDLTGTYQLYELPAAGGGLRQITDFSEPVTGRYLPRSRQAIVQMDTGGNERHQIYLCELDNPPGSSTAALEPLAVYPGSAQPAIGVARDGSKVAYVSNRRDGVDFDVYVVDPSSGDETCVYDGGGWCGGSSGFSPSGRYLAFSAPGDRPLDRRQLLADLENGEIVEILAHPDEAALVGPPAWVSDSSFFLSSNVGRDLAAIVYVDLQFGEPRIVVNEPNDLECHASLDGGTLLVVANDGGAARAALHRVVDGGSLEALGPLPLPDRGVLDVYAVAEPPPPFLGEDGSSIVFSFTSPRMPSDVWRFERERASLERLTISNDIKDEEIEQFAVPTDHVITSFDGEKVPLFLYQPPESVGSSGPRRVVMMIHGGPEAQANLMFSPRLQALVARRLVVIVPNVRGSTGYGKRYAALDDTVNRLDSVADLAAIHAWLATQDLDPTRAVLFGGSYGGYMVLAGCAFQPHLWAAGVAFVAISDLVTFLENTSDYRRAHREREYGSLASDREFLEHASPMRSVDKITAPIFLAHGENDPRVPVGEARQLAAALEARGVRCELVVYPDEGHGLGKLGNIVDAYTRAFDFIEGVVPVG
jgi:dipeptidyl aminopeptidase/acylaminoacyl peptidase